MQPQLMRFKHYSIYASTLCIGLISFLQGCGFSNSASQPRRDSSPLKNNSAATPTTGSKAPVSTPAVAGIAVDKCILDNPITSLSITLHAGVLAPVRLTPKLKTKEEPLKGKLKELTDSSAPSSSYSSDFEKQKITYITETMPNIPAAASAVEKERLSKEWETAANKASTFIISLKDNKNNDAFEAVKNNEGALYETATAENPNSPPEQDYMFGIGVEKTFAVTSTTTISDIGTLSMARESLVGNVKEVCVNSIPCKPHWEVTEGHRYYIDSMEIKINNSIVYTGEPHFVFASSFDPTSDSLSSNVAYTKGLSFSVDIAGSDAYKNLIARETPGCAAKK